MALPRQACFDSLRQRARGTGMSVRTRGPAVLTGGPSSGSGSSDGFSEAPSFQTVRPFFFNAVSEAFSKLPRSLFGTVSNFPSSCSPGTGAGTPVFVMRRSCSCEPSCPVLLRPTNRHRAAYSAQPGGPSSHTCALPRGEKPRPQAHVASGLPWDWLAERRRLWRGVC